MSEVKRKKGESFEGYIRRVKSIWIKSGLLLQARKVQFRVDRKSKNVQKKSAIKRSQKYSKIRYLQKTGRLPMDEH